MQVGLEYVEFCGRPAERLPPPRPAIHAARLRGDEQPPTDGRDLSFASLVLRRAGLLPGCYRPQPLLRRTPACLRAIGARSELDACEAISASAEADARALNALLIGVTSFFRDIEVFQAIARLVLPALGPGGRRVRVWSAGCASGAEVYSVAMLLAEAGRLAGTLLVGTDCRPDAIRFARRAVFDESSLVGLGTARRSMHFDPQPRGAWRAGAPLRRHAAFRVADLTRGAEPGPWDLVLCRNVSIYLSHETADRLAAEIVDQIVPGGFLVVGKAERPPARLPLRRVARGVYRKASHGS